MERRESCTDSFLCTVIKQLFGLKMTIGMEKYVRLFRKFKTMVPCSTSTGKIDFFNYAIFNICQNLSIIPNTETEN